MERIEVACKWYQDWKDKPPTQLALKRFEAIGGTDESIASTLERIAFACFNAAHYKPERDPGQIYRDKIRAEKTRLAQLAKAAHVLALSAGRAEKGMIWACLQAELNSGVSIRIKDSPEPVELNLIVSKYFSHLETAFKSKLPELHGGPWLHRSSIGNLIFNDAISAGRPVTAETMLAYELAFYLRLHTAGRVGDRPQNGQPMPVDGEPCFSVVAAFCIAVFDGKKFTKRDIQDKAKRISDNVRKLKNVGLTDWPQGD